MSERLAPLFDLVPEIDFTDPAKVALLIIDMQYHDASPNRGLGMALQHIAPHSMDYYNSRLEATVVPAIERLLDYFRGADMPVIHLMLGSDYRDLRDCPPRFRQWTRNLERLVDIEDIWWSGNTDFQVRDELAPADGETVLRKTTNGAFNGSTLDFLLQRTGITTLVITGVVTSACIETTARDAADRGYSCVLVDDGLADYDPDMHRATLKAFALNFGRVVETEDQLIDSIRAGESV